MVTFIYFKLYSYTVFCIIFICFHIAVILKFKRVLISNIDLCFYIVHYLCSKTPWRSTSGRLSGARAGTQASAPVRAEHCVSSYIRSPARSSRRQIRSSAPWSSCRSTHGWTVWSASTSVLPEGRTLGRRWTEGMYFRLCVASALELAVFHTELSKLNTCRM